MEDLLDQYLICNVSEDKEFTIGKKYKIIDEKPQYIVIRDNFKNNHLLGKQTDENWIHYETWFELVKK